KNLKHAIFSPPYCNCFDYTEVYKMELWMLDFVTSYEQLSTIREESLSSHLNKKYKKEARYLLPELKIIAEDIPWESTWGKLKTRNMVLNYFIDMQSIFNGIDAILNTGGTIACVVGNSAHGRVPIATDVLLARMLELMGYHDIEIRIARKLSTSSQQQKYLRNNPYLRESIVIAKK
ncbi:MAG: site-specific DNA-methyltransferase, partial [Promethearchaeota archaeon]